MSFMGRQNGFMGLGGSARSYRSRVISLATAAFEVESTAKLWQDSAGTTPVAASGDPVGRIDDLTGHGYNAVQATAGARPKWVIADNGDRVLQNDEFDDVLAATLPDLGTDATIAYVTQSEVYLKEGLTIGAGAYNLPQHDLLGFAVFDRALTTVEKIMVIRWLASKAQGVTYGGDIDAITLACLNAVDVFVYDTSKDSDGGAWRTGALAQASSWYNETLNTATRGARREFPAVAVIVAEAAKVTIYDADDPALPMWMVFETSIGDIFRSAGGSIKSSVAALNGTVVAGDNTYDVHLAAFPSDTARRYGTVGVQTEYIGNIEQRNDGLGHGGATTPNIVNRAVNDVAMTVLPDAPTDPATGLPVPTIAVATAGGVSVIKHDGTVVNSSSTRSYTDITILSDLKFHAVWGAGETTTIFPSLVGLAAGFSATRDLSSVAAPYVNTANQISNVNCASGDDGLVVSNPTKGPTFLLLNSTSLASSMAAFVTTTYNTGWMPGAIRGAWLASKSTAALVGGTVEDRSVKANGLTVSGTITRAPVATGAELVGYSGFSAANYLEGTDASYADTLYALGWEQTGGVWEFKHGVVSAAPIDGLTITGTTLKIEGTKPKALIRLTATVPTADQLVKIENDESALFQENAACTLYGASDAVTALAHDPDTGLLHVGTSAGRSVFHGLERIQNNTTSVSKAISAVGGLVAAK